jgi:uncharacterized protein YaiI (UPF0178 family)
MIETCQNKEVETKAQEGFEISTSPRLPPARPRDWGLGMTVCIAAIAKDDAIVVTSDLMMSTGGFSADKVTVKATRVASHWWVMFSADDISYVTAVLDRVVNLLQSTGNVFSSVRSAFVQAYLDERQNQCEHRVLGSYNIKMARFLQENAQIFTAEESRDLYTRIKNVRLGCSLLAVGFDQLGNAHIFEVSEDANGDVSDKVMDNVGFWAIGTGQYSALSVLFFHEYSRTKEIPTAVYRVAEAKFMAESAQGVGKYTAIGIFKPNLTACFLGQAKLSEIKAAWLAEGAPRTPKNIEKSVEAMINWQPLQSWD